MRYTITAVRVACLCVAVLLLLAPVTGCQQPAKSEATGSSSDVGARRPPERGWSVGWSQLKPGMDAVEVLSLLEEPWHVKVTKVSTTWYYSDRKAEGPHIVFDTRQMRVERWRTPEDR